MWHYWARFKREEEENWNGDNFDFFFLFGAYVNSLLAIIKYYCRLPKREIISCFIQDISNYHFEFWITIILKCVSSQLKIGNHLVNWPTDKNPISSLCGETLYLPNPSMKILDIAWDLDLRRPSFVKIKDFLWNYFINGGGVWLISYLYLFFSNTLQTPLNTLQTPFKIISFFAKKNDGKK